MKKTILKITTAAIALAITPMPPATLMAQEVSSAPNTEEVKTVDADPALWVVKDEDTTIYMLGTIHFLKPGLTWFDEAVKTAFDKSDSVVLEIKPGNPAEDQQKFAQYAVSKTGVTARSKLSEEKQKAYAEAMKKIGLPVNALDPLKPWAVGLVMQISALQKVGFDPNQGVEKILEGEANAQKKEIIGLETTDFQFGIFDSFSEKTQTEFLVQSIDGIADIEAGLNALITPWAAGDPETLATLLHQELSNPEIYRKLLTKRNANWAKWINDRMDKPGTVFMAVGAGHLAGDVEVQELITAYGLKAERINY